MLLGVARPSVIAGCVLNDIGPVIQAARLVRIKELRRQAAATGKLPGGADMLRKLSPLPAGHSRRRTDG
jgi:hypothetical protein